MNTLIVFESTTERWQTPRFFRRKCQRLLWAPTTSRSDVSVLEALEILVTNMLKTWWNTILKDGGLTINNDGLTGKIRIFDGIYNPMIWDFGCLWMGIQYLQMAISTRTLLIFLNLLNMFFARIVLELIYHLWHLLRRLVFLLVAPSSKPRF